MEGKKKGFLTVWIEIGKDSKSVDRNKKAGAQQSVTETMVDVSAPFGRVRAQSSYKYRTH